MKYQYDLMIAGIAMQWQSEFPLKMDKRYQEFLQKNEVTPEIILEVHTGYAKRDNGTERILFDGKRFLVKEDDKYRYRVFPYDCTRPEKVITLIRPYCTENNDTKVWRLYIPSDATEHFQQSESRTFYIAFEELLYTHGRVLLHSSYVETKDGAILFTGPSGVGKSTQAELWAKYGDGEVMNGDRTVLYEQDGKILASGSPCAGSSGIYRNYQSPVRAIVVLSQGNENKIERIRGWKSLIPLIRESNFSYMDEVMKQNQMELLFSVAERIPVYEYQCKRDSSAVKALQRVLEQEIL